MKLLEIEKLTDCVLINLLSELLVNKEFNEHSLFYKDSADMFFSASLNEFESLL